MTQAACLVLLADVIREHPLSAVSQPLDLVTFERAVVFALSKKRLGDESKATKIMLQEVIIVSLE